MNSLVIVGGVAAGPKAAIKAKREKPDWNVVLITDEKYTSYSGCSLPYYIGGILDSEDSLIVKHPSQLRHDFGIEVFVEHKVLKIDFNNQTVQAMDLSNGSFRTFEYDQLVIASGASAVLPPSIQSGAPNLFTLRNVKDGIGIKKYIDKEPVQSISIIGGSFIGLELAENLRNLGFRVSLIEFADQILPSFDNDIARLIQNIAAENGISVFTGERANGFRFDAGQRKITQIVTNKRVLDTDLVIISAGVKPNTDYLSKGEIALTGRGTICVNEFMQTSIPGIYAAGDCAENLNLITGKNCWYPMGSTANKTGRVCGENLVDPSAQTPFKGVMGTVILKLFKVAVGKTGLSEKDADDAGIEIEAVIIGTENKPKHYPDAENIIIKLIARKADGKILGAQALGKGPIDKYIDTIATSIYLNAKIEDLQAIDLCYSPLFSTPISAVNLAANVLKNKSSGLYEKISAVKLKTMLTDASVVLVDVREEDEFALEYIPGSINVSFINLRFEYQRIEKEKLIILICESGKRAYMAYRYLSHLGYRYMKVLDGGLQVYPFQKASKY